MKDNTKKILSAIFYSFIAFVIIIAYYVAISQSLSFNLIILGMIIAGIVATDFFVFHYKKSKYYVLIYAISLISIYLVGAYLYTFPFLRFYFFNLVCNGCGSPVYLITTNHFYVLVLTNTFAYYKDYYIPYNVSLYEPTYSMFPFQTSLPNLVNQTITLKILVKNQTFDVNYKVASETLIENFENFRLNTKKSYHYYSMYIYNFSTPVYLLNLTAEITNPEFITFGNWNNFTLIHDTKLTGWVVSAEYDGITIT